jgi:MerR family transcriptional regulator, light-induced transcriptional regulator
MNAFTIKDLENLSGIKAHTIRIWEQRYDFLKPRRTETNIRYYSNDELKTVLNIALLNKYGFKISHIGRMQPQELRERILSLTDGRAMQERLVNELVQTMIDLDMDQFEKIVGDYIMARGIEKTVLMLLFPFLEKIGILWQTGHINPAQEHLVSNTVRQKLIMGIETVVPHTRMGKTCLLFLPEGEHHELGLLFMYYLLKSRGAKTLYLGANVPLKDVEQVVELKKPDLVFVHLTGTASGFNFEKFLYHVSQRLGQIPTIVSGQITQQYKKKVPGCVQFKQSLTEVMEFLSSL